MTDTTSITSLPPAALMALQSGNKLEAIKLTREATGVGLAEAKALVEAHERDAPGQSAACEPAGPPDLPAAVAALLPEAVVQALNSGNKIEAIRLLREHTGLGLKQAKDRIEGVASPGDALAPGEVPASGGGAWLWIGAVLLALAGYWAWRTFG